MSFSIRNSQSEIRNRMVGLPRLHKTRCQKGRSDERFRMRRSQWRCERFENVASNNPFSFALTIAKDRQVLSRSCFLLKKGSSRGRRTIREKAETRDWRLETSKK